MELLSQEEQADLKKMASDRIRLVLAPEGADLDELAKAERNQLLEMMAVRLLNRNAQGILRRVQLQVPPLMIGTCNCWRDN